MTENGRRVLELLAATPNGREALRAVALSGADPQPRPSQPCEKA